MNDLDRNTFRDIHSGILSGRRDQAIARAAGAKVNVVRAARRKLESVGVDAQTELFTTPQAAAVLGLTDSLVRRYCRDGYLVAKKWGTQHQIAKTDLLEFLAEGGLRPKYERA